MASGLLSKGAKLGYSTSGSAPITYTNLPDLQSVGELFGDAETVEVTTLADNRRRYIKGLADSQSVECTFLYANGEATDSFRVLKGYDDSSTLLYLQIELPDTTKISFSGYVSVKLNEVAVGEPLTFVCTIAINSAMTVTNPA